MNDAFGDMFDLDVEVQLPLPAVEDYVFKIESISKHTSGKGTSGVKIRFRVDTPPKNHPEVAGRALTRFFPLVGEGVGFTMPLLHALGIDPTAGKLSADAFVGKRVMGDIKHEFTETGVNVQLVRVRALKAAS